MFDILPAARLLDTYTRQYHAGAFAVPLRAELAAAAAAGRLHVTGPSGAPETVAVELRPARALQRADFTGAPYTLPAGHRVLTHLAAAPGGRWPSFAAFDIVYGYLEDTALVQHLRAEGFTPLAVKISASSELVGVWHRGPARAYPAYDVATLTEVPCVLTPTQQQAMRAEVAGLAGWRDDYPYYHRGEWSQLALRGYAPTDPGWCVKPSEMSRSWKQAHPVEARRDLCQWTTLAPHVPTLWAFVQGMPWWQQCERVRLLRLTQGHLVRHTDITDRAAGTADGKISRFHLPLVTHPAIRTRAWTLDGACLDTHWQPGHLYYLDQRKPHAVDNPTPVERVHLVVDVVSDAAVRAMIAAGVPPCPP